MSKGTRRRAALLLLAAGAAAAQATYGWDFTRTQSLPPGTTFTRSGATATRINAQGLIEVVPADTPRFNYDIITGACRGLLIEEARTNLIANSIGLSGWTNGGTYVVADQVNGLDGTLTADQFICASNANPQIYVSFTAVSGTTYTWSVFAKRNPNSAQAMDFTFVPQGTAVLGEVRFNLALGTATATTGTPIATGIENYGGGWYRCWCSFAATASGTGYHQINMCDPGWTAGNHVASPDASSGLFLWGAQLEAGAFVSSFIRTTSGTLTRNADVCRITSIPWLNVLEGTLVASYDFYAIQPSTPGFNQGVAIFDKNTGFNEAIGITNASTTLTRTNSMFLTADGGATQCAIVNATFTTADINLVKTVAAAWKANDFATSLNGGAVGTDVSGTVPTGLTQLRLGDDYSGSGARALCGHVRWFEYYNRRVANNNLPILSKRA